MYKSMLYRTAVVFLPILCVLLVDGAVIARWERFKREFMFVSDSNSTDPGCFQDCTDDWKKEFQDGFSMKMTDYYDFPFHPLILHYPHYLKYCDLAEKRTKCFMDRCDDDSAERVFSPSNFICHFKRQQFLTARSCLEETEPITFLKCDQYCHTKAVESIKADSRANMGEVFTKPELTKYERELDLLCTFQECYPSAATDLIQAFIQLHAIDIYDWHLMSDNMVSLPESCARLTARSEQLEEDPVVKIFNNE
ncbi:hypothetical protein QR680_007549 [Steinernema hermaphroditum]|uniref:Uncharacterized protein n=1 Tax=Steinernema hermaphroditum TaxID=289476 RepID=A0AA39IEX8_9BILA|nr:hypothetical protein QR680_007549 [Steinernema hermaphroditum]